jgi:lipopolysaccharide export system permease protein
MHTFDSYILRQATKPLLTAVVVALLLLLVERMMRLLDFVLDSRGTLDVLLQLLTVLVPHYLGLALPAALFLALTIAFGRMQRDSELDAMLSAGIGLHQQLRPAFKLAVTR